MKKAEYTGYISKSGKNGLYKITARFTTPEGVKRVKLQGFGKEPFTFWVDESKLCDPPSQLAGLMNLHRYAGNADARSPIGNAGTTTAIGRKAIAAANNQLFTIQNISKCLNFN